MAQGELPRRGEADDPRADDDHVALRRRTPPPVGRLRSRSGRYPGTHPASSIALVALPLKPPVQPQLALSRKEIPEGEEWVYEPKFDGFRALAFVDGEDVYLQSRTGKPLLRYFPELVFPAGRYVLDGELVILGADDQEVFDALQNRLHPAESRVRMLAAETPALFRAFDLLAEGKEKLLTRPFAERRERLESMVAGLGGRRKSAAGSIELTPLAEVPPRPPPGSSRVRG